MKSPAKNLGRKLGRKIAVLVLGVSALGIGGRGALQCARANVLDNIGGAISSLRDQKTRASGAAQSARSRARAQARQVEFLHERLRKTQRLLDAANASYIDSFKQMQVTEERIEAAQARAQEVEARYEEHKTQFGLRLASMQRHGQTNFLQVALGSMSLSDLSRRTAFFQALTQRDAALQARIKNDKAEIARSQNALMAQWNERRVLQKQAARERKRIAQGEAQQMQSWKQMNRARYDLLSFVMKQQQSLENIDGKIGSLRARASQVLSENAERAARARAREMNEREMRGREMRVRLAQLRAEVARERDAMRAQTRFRSRVRRRVVRSYNRNSQARRYASQQRENFYSNRRRYGNGRYRNSSYANSGYGSGRYQGGRSRRTRYARNSYSRRSSRNSSRYARVSRIDPQNLPQFAPRVGLMPRYAPRIELAPMPIEALQNPGRLAPAAP